MKRWLLVLVLVVGCGPRAHFVSPSPGYPYRVCPVTGRGLDELADRRAVEFCGRELQTCCQHCAQRVVADPERYYGVRLR